MPKRRTRSSWKVPVTLRPHRSLAVSYARSCDLWHPHGSRSLTVHVSPTGTFMPCEWADSAGPDVFPSSPALCPDLVRLTVGASAGRSRPGAGRHDVR